MATTRITGPFDRAVDPVSAPEAASASDLDRYRSYVAHLDMPQARKDDIILAVRRIMQSFVDRAFGDDPVQRSGRIEDKSPLVVEVAAPPVIGSDEAGSPERNNEQEER